MATITLKNVPEDLRAALRKRAESNRRSLNQEVLYCLEQAVGQGPGSDELRAEWLAQSQRTLTRAWDNEDDDVYNALLEK